jgi:hypothetical protein
MTVAVTTTLIRRKRKMARPPAYRLYCGELATMHAGNDLQDLIGRAKLHSKIFGGRYLVKDIYGSVVWEGNNDGKA